MIVSYNLYYSQKVIFVKTLHDKQNSLESEYTYWRQSTGGPEPRVVSGVQIERRPAGDIEEGFKIVKLTLVRTSKIVLQITTFELLTNWL